MLIYFLSPMFETRLFMNAFIYLHWGSYYTWYNYIYIMKDPYSSYMWVLRNALILHLGLLKLLIFWTFKFLSYTYFLDIWFHQEIFFLLVLFLMSKSNAMMYPIFTGVICIFKCSAGSNWNKKQIEDWTHSLRLQ